jgi:hypothetical protein
MAKIALHPDFKDFLRLPNSHDVRYLLVGGYALGYHGYPRATGAMDIWIEMSESNSKKVASAFRDFGMPEETITESLFPEKNKVIRNCSGCLGCRLKAVSFRTLCYPRIDRSRAPKTFSASTIFDSQLDISCSSANSNALSFV